MNSTLEAVLRAVQFLDAHLTDEVQIGEAAQQAGYSLFHFSRVFNRTVRFTPYDYLMRRRLSEAAQMLSGGYPRVLDVAVEYQFGSSEAFGRAFRRMWGLLPSDVRGGSAWDGRLFLPPLTMTDLEYLQTIPLTPYKTETEAVRLAGWMLTEMPDADSLGSLVRRMANELKPYGVEPIQKWVGVIHYLHAVPVPYPVFFMGIPDKQLRESPDFMTYMDLPSETGSLLTCSGKLENLNLDLAYAFHTFWPQNSNNRLPLRIRVEFENGPDKVMKPVTLFLPET